MGRGSRMREWATELGRAVRTHRRHPGAAILVLVTLGLGIGAVTSVAAILKGVLLTPFPYPGADELVLVQEERDGDPISVSYPNYLDWQERTRTLAGLAAYQYTSFTVQTGDRVRRARGYRVTASLFEVLRTEAAFGRVVSIAEDAPGSPPVAVVSYGLWQTALGGDPEVLGRALLLDGVPHDVIGVMPEGFEFWSGGEVWVPLGPLVQGSELESRGTHAGVYVVGRLAPGLEPTEAAVELTAIAAELEVVHPDANSGVRPRLRTFTEAVLGNARGYLSMLLAAVLLLLVVACLNVAGVVQARNSERVREIGIRLALGSGRRRLVRQFLAESMVLALAGGVFGLGIAWLVPALVRAFGFGGIPRLEHVRVDPWIAAVAFGISTLVGVAVALMPALSLRAGHLGREAGRSGRSTVGRAALRAQSGLLAVQVALAVVLSIGAALVARSVQGLTGEDLGFETEGVLAFRVDLPQARYGWSERPPFYEALVERIEALPGVASAGVVEPLPLSGRDRSQSVHVEGRPYAGRDDLEPVDYAPATAGYFEAMGIPLLAGRLFESTDDGEPSVTIVSESTAERFWPGEDPLGKTLVGGGPESGNPPLTVVGVVGDVRHYGVRGEVPSQMYFHYRQLPLGGTVVVDVERGDPAALLPSVRAAVGELDSAAPIYDAGPLVDLFDRTVADERTVAWALGFFSTFAMLLALLGVYGVTARAATARTRELAVRSALGARPPALVGRLVRGPMPAVLMGLAGGVLGAALTSRVLGALLYGVAPTDPATFATVAAAVVAAAVLSAAVPAARVLGLAPADVLREE